MVANVKLDNLVFFLGGYDAEMITIKELLEEKKLSFHDKGLSWGAKASDYKEEIIKLQENKIPVLIELTVDIELPLNAIIIDHHNKKENNKSSIEQVAELLGVKLDRWQQLIAANDKGYIPAMECLCATEEEIEKVRAFDRKAQGVTEEDERLAEESIKKNQTEENGIITIKSLTEKFSPIADKMFGRTNNLLIFTDDKLTYYGERKKQIVNKFKNLIDEGKAYYGGGENGFWGLSKDKVTTDEVNEIKKEIINMNFEANNPISHHIFLFPFKWDLKSKDKHIEEISFKDRIELKKISEIIKDKNNFDESEGIKWLDFKFEIIRPRDYNEFSYFYEYVTAALFDCEKEIDKTDWDKKVILQYNLDIEKNKSKYLINIVERDPDPMSKPKIPAITYELIIEDVIINFYQTGVGIFSFHLSNYRHNKPEQILDINDFGRRIYPQFLNDGDPKFPLKSVKEAFLANCIELELKIPDQNEMIKIKDCFTKFCKEFNGMDPKRIPKLPEFITKLLGKKFKDTEKDLRVGDVKLTPIIDDRMFTICWYGNDSCSKLLMEKQWLSEQNRYEYNYEKNELWNRFIFVDNRSNGLANNNFLRDLNLKHTYSRWIDKGTFFGISRYSFIMLTNREGFAIFVLFPHLQTVYFQLVMLALLQRASLIRFSDEATKVKYIELIKNKSEVEDRLENIKQLYGKYLHFVNKIFFREPTAQEQGIELYDMLLDKMRIEREVKDLDRELNELHNYISITVQEKETKEIRLLSNLATWFLPATLIAGILGMNTLPEPSKIPQYLFDGGFYWPLIISLILQGSFTLVVYLIFKKVRKK